MLASLGALYSMGQPVDWQALYPQGGRCVSLPGYPWQHQSYWHEATELRQVRLGEAPHPLLGRDLGAADPTWEVRLDRRLLGYLDDHRVQGQAVFPAAAYVEMALAAARKVLGEEPCSLEEMQFQKALFLSDTDAVPTVQLIVYPPDASFAIHSRVPQADPAWLQHATGYLRRQPALPPPAPVDLAALRREIDAERSVEDSYRSLEASGLHYGPAFQGIKQLWSRDGEALGQIQLPDDLLPDARHYTLHPAVLDACFQVLFGALPAADTTNRLYLPVQLERLRLYRRPARLVWSHAHLSHWSPKSLVGDIRLYDEAGSLLAELEGFRCQAVQGERQNEASNVDHWFYEVRWHSKPRLPQRLVPRSADYLPAPRELVQAMASEVWSRPATSPAAPGGPAHAASLDQLARAYLGQTITALDWRCQPGERLSLATLMLQCQLPPSLQPRLGWFMRLLEKAGYLVRLDTEVWDMVSLPPQDDPDACWRRAMSHATALFAELNALTRCGTHLAAVLRGTMEPEQLLLGQDSDTLVEHLYQDSPTFAPGNSMLQRVMREMLQRLPGGRTVRILDVGTSCGGLTTYVLPTVPAERATYVLADASPSFRVRAAQKWRDYPFLQVQALDFDADPVPQGYEPHSFDLILASGRLPTLEHIVPLLSPDGVFLFLGFETTPLWLELVCGVLQGWWSVTADGLLPGEALPARQRWQRILQEAGFAQVEALPVASHTTPSAQVLMLARGPALQPEVRAAAPVLLAPFPGVQPGRWLIVADSHGVAQQVVEGLKAAGEVCLQVTPGDAFRQLDAEHFTISPHQPEDMECLLRSVAASDVTSWRGIIHLWSVDTPPPSQTSLLTLQHAEALGCHCIMHLVQALHHQVLPPDGMPRLILVTRNAQPVDGANAELAIAQSQLLGLGRTLLNEHPELHCKLVDLGPDLAAPEIASLLAELQTDDAEAEIALRYGERFAPRLEPWSPEPLVVHQVGAEPTPFRLALPPSGVIDRLTFHATRRHPPGPGQVEIEVEAAALNFRDVMKALGLYPTDNDQDLMLGDECAGRIVALGDGVETFKLGDPVLAVAPGSLGSHVTTLAALAMLRPEPVTCSEAAGLPIVFLTAYYALHHLARLQAGERVLIHAAAGGVGLAALQLAQQAGAEIFATAGSPEKRHVLSRLGVAHVLDSRSLAFAEHIREITHGEGVDIVLNSLAGEAIARGIACLAPYGRFLELGKRDIYQNSKLGLRALRKNVSFFTVDLGALLLEKPALAQSLLAELWQRLRTRHFYPLPQRVFPAWRVAEAFQHMAQARHMGKIVVAMQGHDVSIVPPQHEAVTFRPDATYLVTGGCGGFGLAVARWIVEQGGRHLVLVGRHGAASAESRQALEALQQTGAQVVVARADVTEEQQLAAVLADIEPRMPPLRGVFHAAAHIDDSLLLRLDAARFSQVMAPKVHGAWNLHTLTRQRELDYFVLFSSVSSLIGNPGQGNYVAANTFLDAMATYRRAVGLPATTINWGHLTEVGYVARHQEVSQALTRLGVLGITPSQALQALDRLLQHKPVQMAVIHMDWPQWARSMPHQQQRVSSLVSITPQAFSGDEVAHLRQMLQGATPEARQEIVQTYIRDQAARVLGAAAARLDVERPLNELGLDSLMAVQLKNRLENDLGLTLPTSELLRSPSIARLQALVLEQLAIPAASQAVPYLRRQESAAQALLQVEQLSDEEVDALLRQLGASDRQAACEAEERSVTHEP